MKRKMNRLRSLLLDITYISCFLWSIFSSSLFFFLLFPCHFSLAAGGQGQRKRGKSKRKEEIEVEGFGREKCVEGYVIFGPIAFSFAHFLFILSSRSHSAPQGKAGRKEIKNSKENRRWSPITSLTSRSQSQ